MVSIDRARHYVHANGTMWERALWDHLFDDGPIERVHQTLACYRNPDGGFGHGLEHDAKCPASTPICLEFLMTIFRDTGISPGALLDGAADWVEANQNHDGTLASPDDLIRYPVAPWQKDGHDSPASITGHLVEYNQATPGILSRTGAWARQNLTLDAIRANDWLFMCYRPFDYFMNITEFDRLAEHREATIENIGACAIAHEAKGEMSKLFPLFQFVDGLGSPLLAQLPDGLVDRVLDHLAGSQREDGGWADEHGLAYWQPYFSTVVLLALRRFNRV